MKKVMLKFAILGLVCIICLAAQGCNPSYPQKEVEQLKSKFEGYSSDTRLDEWGEFANECVRGSISKLFVVDVEEGDKVRLKVRIAKRSYTVQINRGKVEWGEYTKSGHDDSGFDKLDLNEVDEEILQNYRRLLELGLVGYEQSGRDFEVKLYLEKNLVLIVILPSTTKQSRNVYETYSAAGHDPRGDAIEQINDSIFIQTERR